ncbi:TetR/AcrR family transcriptional regulator [Rhodococcus sp. ZPP]|uniref:TetR/AcrR family transcriptional regulator n=1 Tax=Rhodococcus sp. ZPP TaxID=2749906 RepID=UPI001AD8866A|nr:TetR/AcrR family transcriptional regulator [Rhodococcus sp. ZPP]
MLKKQTRQASGGGAEMAVRRGRPPGDPEVKRVELLKAATSTIAEEGYANASLRKVAQRAGYTTGAVTYYFANKEELVLALVESRFDRYDAMLEGIQAEAAIEALFERWLRLTTSDPEFWPVMSELLAHARHDPALAAVYKQRYGRFREVYTSIIAAGQVRGTVRDDISADLLADQLSAMADGWALLFPLEPERFTPGRVRELVDAAVALIAPVPGARR